jgi:hypothetical protein
VILVAAGLITIVLMAATTGWLIWPIVSAAIWLAAIGAVVYVSVRLAMRQREVRPHAAQYVAPRFRSPWGVAVPVGTNGPTDQQERDPLRVRDRPVRDELPVDARRHRMGELRGGPPSSVKLVRAVCRSHATFVGWSDPSDTLTSSW